MLRIYLLLILIVLFLFWLNRKLKEYKANTQKRVLLDFSEENEDLEKIRVVTNQLITIEKEYFNTEIQAQLASVIDLQVELVQLFQKNQKNLSENIKRIILYYTNSILNVLQKWSELRKKMDKSDSIMEGNQRILALLNKWQKLLQNIRLKLLNSQYAVLDAEIQALLDGLNLDS